MPSLKPVLVVGLAGVLVLAGGVTTAVHGVGTTPDDVAKDYLAALSAGHVRKALALSVHPATLNRALLTSDLPEADRITRAALVKVTRKENKATVDIAYDVGGAAEKESLQLSKHGGSWLVDNGLSSLSIDGAALDVTTVTVNGKTVKVTAGSADLPALPGVYHASMAPTFAFTAVEQESVVTTVAGTAHFDLEGTTAGEAEAKAAVLRVLKACLAKAPQTIQDPCGMKTTLIKDAADFKNTDIRWTLVKAPELLATAIDGSYDVLATAAGKAKVSAFATDLKHRVPPQRITLPVTITFAGIAEVTFRGRTAKATLTPLPGGTSG